MSSLHIRLSLRQHLFQARVLPTRFGNLRNFSEICVTFQKSAQLFKNMRNCSEFPAVDDADHEAGEIAAGVRGVAGVRAHRG